MKRTKITEAIQLKENQVLHVQSFDTPLGSMIAIGDQGVIYLLEFIERRGLEREIDRLKKHMKSDVVQGETQPLKSIRDEIKQYFEGKLDQFNTPFVLLGTPFQKQVWQALMKTPYAQTCSYADLAKSIDKPTSYRAVALANGANQLAIMIPCHRVINTNGELGGYGGGIERKQWLLNHEKKSIGLNLTPKSDRLSKEEFL